MDEEKIIEILKDFTENEDTVYCYDWHGFDYEVILPAIQGLLDLYNKEKEKNKELKEGLKYRINYCKLLEKELYANGINYEMEKTEIEKRYLED